MTGRVLVLDQARGVWGAQNYLLRLAQPMAQRGFDLVLGGSAELELAQAWTRRGLEHVRINLPLTRSVRAHGDGSRLALRPVAHEAEALARGVRAIARAVSDAGAGAVHANGHAVHLDAALAGRLAGLPVVLHLHEEMEQGFGRVLRMAAVATATRSVAVSHAVAGGVPAPLRRRVEVIANGVDIEALRPGPTNAEVRAQLGAGPEDVLLVALTRLDPDKRIGDLVAALAPLVDRPGWHLAVVGTTSSYEQYAQEVRALAADRLGVRVTFAGRREDVSSVLAGADVVVHTGVVEGMPLGLIEAQACGVPVVAYRVAGVPEAVVEGTTGLLAAAGDTVQLGRHIQTLIDDADLRRRMGAAGRDHVVAGHSIDAQADAYAGLLDRLTSPGGGRTGTGRTGTGRTGTGHTGTGNTGTGNTGTTADGAHPRVLLANHWHDDNRGDSAITQGILSLIRATAPDSAVTVSTLAEDGALWVGSTRHLQRAWPGLTSRPSPVPTELRGRTGARSRAAIAGDLGLWVARLVRFAPAMAGLGTYSPWHRLVEQQDLVILVGGSNVFDDSGVPAVLSLPRLAEVLSPARAAVRAGTPVVLVGHTLGPFSRPWGRRIAAAMLAGVDRVVVREARSIAVANSIGLDRVEEAPDMAFALIPDHSAKVKDMLAALPADPRRTLVLSARQHPTLGRQADERLVEVFAQAARQLIAAGVVDGVAVVAHTIGPTPVEDDRPVSRLLFEALGDVAVALVDRDVSPSELSAFYGGVGAVVAVRLHAAILALNAGTPTFAVSYLTAKTQGVMTQVGLPDAVADFATVTAGAVVDGIKAQLSDPELRVTLQKKADARRQDLFDAAGGGFSALTGPNR